MTERLSEDDRRRLAEAVAVANVPSLLMVLVQLTGDERWLADPYRPGRPRGVSDVDHGYMPEEIQAEIREAALGAILAWKDGEPAKLEHPSDAMLARMLSWCMGEEVPERYGPMISVDIGLPDPKAPEPVQAPEGFEVLVIGAGIAGMTAAYNLGRAGIPFRILERNESVGGVWWENRYPGCGVDTPSHLYSFSFARNDWSRYFALRDELQAYFERVADEFDIRRHVQFRTEVTGAEYDEDSQTWTVHATGPDGDAQTFRANVLITAVGIFNKPRIPHIEGLERFQGPAVHTARWPEDLELAGKRVAVIGNGATGMQVVPEIADATAHVIAFQHSPQWAAPFEKFRVEVPPALHLLMREVPLYELWYRQRQAWIFNDRTWESLQKDPGWEHPERSLNRVNDAHRKYFTRYIEDEVGDRTELLDDLVPTYPPFGKRILLDNRWFHTMARDDVELVTSGVAEVTETAVVDGASVAHEVDVIVLATGFDVIRFLAPLDIRGRSGNLLREEWNDDDARAYLGLTVPDYPNLFMMYGPNTQTGHGGSVLYMMEMQMRYIMSVLTQAIDGGLGAVEVRQDVFDDYNARVDAAHEKMVWTHRGMSTYYRNANGRVVVNNPFRVIEFWTSTREADLGEYVTEPAAGMLANA